MNYLLDKKNKKNKYIKIALGVVGFIILFFLKTSIWNGISYMTGSIFRPILVSGNSVGEKFKNIGAYFSYKSSLFKENADLKSRIERDVADRANYDSVVEENVSLKEILNRKSQNNTMMLSAILAKPNQTLHDTLLIDIGIDKGLKVGDKVFALGNVPIGRIAEVFANSSKVVLFSNSGEKIQVIVSGKNVFMELIGRGGGNFEMILPRDFVLLKGDQVVLPGIEPYVVGIVETIISDPRDAFQKALLVSPVNIQELKFIEVEF